jgi:acyl dehydratase
MQRRARDGLLPLESALHHPLVTHTVEFTREQIRAYAEASGDHNPIHLDDEFARQVGLPGVIAHGMLQMGLMANLAVEAAGGDPRRVKRLGCRFSAMVLPGDRVTFSGEVDANGRMEITAAKRDGERILTKAFAEIDRG